MQPILKMFDRRAFILAEDVAMKVVEARLLLPSAGCFLSL